MDTNIQQTNAPQDIDPVDAYVIELLKLTGVDVQDTVLVEELKPTIMGDLNAFIAEEIAQKLPEEAQAEYIKKIEEAPSNEDVVAFVRNYIPNLEEVYQELFARFALNFKQSLEQFDATAKT
jgi:hypothetical protein